MLLWRGRGWVSSSQLIGYLYNYKKRWAYTNFLFLNKKKNYNYILNPLNGCTSTQPNKTWKGSWRMSNIDIFLFNIFSFKKNIFFPRYWVYFIFYAGAHYVCIFLFLCTFFLILIFFILNFYYFILLFWKNKWEVCCLSIFYFYSFLFDDVKRNLESTSRGQVQHNFKLIIWS